MKLVWYPSRTQNVCSAIALIRTDDIDMSAGPYFDKENDAIQWALNQADKKAEIYKIPRHHVENKKKLLSKMNKELH